MRTYCKQLGLGLNFQISNRTQGTREETDPIHPEPPTEPRLAVNEFEEGALQG